MNIIKDRVKTVINRILEVKLVKGIVKVVSVPFIGYLLLACLLNLLLESLSRHSLMKAFIFIGHSPLVFLYNVTIIFLTLSLVLFTRRRFFATVFVCTAWIVSAFANWIVLCFRTTPFSAIDVLMIRNVMTMLDKYMRKWQIVLSIVGILVAIAFLIYLYIRLPKTEQKRHPLRASVYVCMCGMMLMALTKVAVESDIISDNFGNLAYAYNDYGFAYCFSNSIIDVGVSKPKGYNKEMVDHIVADMDYSKEPVEFEQPGDVSVEDTTEEVNQEVQNVVESSATDVVKATAETPNIIVIQLESAFDVKYMKGLLTSDDPMPTFTYLKNNYSTGLFTVPAVGAGTANTEFEVQTGMSTQFFGAGEYPFKTVMRSTSCDSMAYDLKRQGYTTCGFHNNDATFYERYVDYSNLGFESFSGMEHMYQLSYTPRGWAKDSRLDDLMLEQMRKTEGCDYITTITVQGHGRYPSKISKTMTDLTCRFYGNEYAGDEVKKAAWQYYINMLRETDIMLADLIKGIEQIDEPTVVFMYGDHLPSLNLQDTDLDGINLYQTEWVMWDNIGLTKEDQDMTSYQASTYIFNKLGIEGGLMQHFHNKYMHAKNQDVYMKALEVLEYDTLYGERYAFNCGNPFPKTDMVMGIREIAIDRYYEDSKGISIYGKGFNEFSIVYVDGKAVDTIYKTDKYLRIPSKAFDGAKEFYVAQEGDDHVVLSVTETMLIDTDADSNQTSETTEDSDSEE